MHNDDCYFEEGLLAQREGLSNTDNPYLIGSDEAMSWDDGFRSAEIAYE